MTAEELKAIASRSDENALKNRYASSIAEDIDVLVAEINRLREYEWMYKDLCK